MSILKKNEIRLEKEKGSMQEEQKSISDKDFKYILQDTSYIYLGARYSYQELLEEESIAFKLKTIISQYLLKDVDEDTTLESHFYYMTPDSFAFQTYRELKVKVKVSMPVEKRSLTGKIRYEYKDKVYSLKEFGELNLAKKKQLGIIIREIVFSKLGLMTFTV